jgi:hypothetical protein
MGKQVTIENALLYPDSAHTLLSSRDIRKYGLHVITHEENNEEFIHIIRKTKMAIIFWREYLPHVAYYTYIKLVPHVAYKVIFLNIDAFTTWHEQLGQLGLRTMWKILGNSIGHNLSEAKFPKSLILCVLLLQLGN